MFCFDLFDSEVKYHSNLEEFIKTIFQDKTHGDG